MRAMNGSLGAGDYDRVELNGFTNKVTDVRGCTSVTCPIPLTERGAEIFGGSVRQSNVKCCELLGVSASIVLNADKE